MSQRGIFGAAGPEKTQPNPLDKDTLKTHGRTLAKTLVSSGDFDGIGFKMVYLEVKDAFPKLDPLSGVWDGVVEATLGHTQHLKHNSSDFTLLKNIHMNVMFHFCQDL